MVLQGFFIVLAICFQNAGAVIDYVFNYQNIRR